jgi:hypothetical protein
MIISKSDLLASMGISRNYKEKNFFRVINS